MPYFAPYELRHRFATRLRAREPGRPHGDADVETVRCQSFQAVQSGKARDDARGDGQIGSASERSGSIEHTNRGLIDFMNIFEHNQSAVEHPASQELLMVKGLTVRAAGI